MDDIAAWRVFGSGGGVFTRDSFGSVSTVRVMVVSRFEIFKS